jgi:microfibrillar-associated protein 1
LKRDALIREQAEREKKELERRRAMTEEERLAEDKKLGIGIFKEKEKEKWKFMQRYYHKGVFYMDEDSTKPQVVDPSSGQVKVDVRNRDYSAPTLEDRYDKEQLPGVLQVKKFGMRGRTKYTHLVDQDTTDFQNPLKPNQKVLEKYLNKRSGVGDIDSATRGSKRPKI